MAKANWRELLGWTEDQLSELRLSGFSFLREGQYNKALIFFEALVILDPRSVYDIQTLGALYLQLGKEEKALKQINQALDLEPTHEPTLINKVKALLTLNRANEALIIARNLEHSKDPTIANEASALISAYS
ncbi:MAG: tetratricopeptide repeat protein [Chlamydiales bacterium]